MSKPSVKEIQTEFAKWGHVGCPLTMRDIEVCWRHRFGIEDIYGIGCDVAAGYSIEDVLPFYFKRECEI